MEPKLKKSRGKNKTVAIIGAGASGCICTYHLLKAGISVTLYDKNLPLRTLLPTGGGRCNLAHAEYDFKELAKNYPRGEKFLYSVFSQFSTSDTISMFEEMGIKTYVQEDDRIFPESNSAKDVQEVILRQLRKLGVNFIQGKINDLSDLFEKYDYVIIATGGHSGYELLEPYDIKIVEPHPSLVGLNTEEDFKDLSGTALKGVKINDLEGDILFTHFGVSGPLIYKISSLKAFDEMPYDLTIDLCPEMSNLQENLNSNPHKEIKNILTEFLPQKVVQYILKDMDKTLKAHQINGKTRDLITDRIHNFKITITVTNKGEETVTAGGIDLDEINPKTMKVKKVPNLYCIGEILNIDGFCGGFNLQNAWSTAFVCANSIISQAK